MDCCLAGRTGFIIEMEKQRNPTGEDGVGVLSRETINKAAELSQETSGSEREHRARTSTSSESITSGV